MPASQRIVLVLGFPLLVALASGCRKADAEVQPQADGAQLFAAACARCHGPEGFGGQPSADGKTPAPRNFHDAEFQASHTDAQIKGTIVNGKNGFMPPFGATFDDAQLSALVRHVRSFDSARGPTR